MRDGHFVDPFKSSCTRPPCKTSDIYVVTKWQPSYNLTRLSNPNNTARTDVASPLVNSATHRGNSIDGRNFHSILPYILSLVFTTIGSHCPSPASVLTSYYCLTILASLSPHLCLGRRTTNEILKILMVRRGSIAIY